MSEAKSSAFYAADMVARFDVKTVNRATFDTWRNDDTRTTYVLDVRSQGIRGGTHARIRSRRAASSRKAPINGAAQNARIVLIDDDANVRAVTTAHWLVQMGCVRGARGGIAGDGTETGMPKRTLGLDALVLEEMDGDAVVAGLAAGELALADTDVSEDYVLDRRPASPGVCPRAQALLHAMRDAPKIVLYSMHEAGAIDRLRFAGNDGQADPILSGGRERWKAEGRSIEPTPSDAVSQEDRIDFLFWVHDRHLGNDQAARDYLAWEEQLPAQIEADGDATYNIGSS